MPGRAICEVAIRLETANGTEILVGTESQLSCPYKRLPKPEWLVTERPRTRTARAGKASNGQGWRAAGKGGNRRVYGWDQSINQSTGGVRLGRKRNRNRMLVIN